ncbi:MAG TPA: ABC transporter permease [Pyrinomonadaceae bacterium]|nr:ABC transporter permease [Pyrinomonadaceae bacterium]
MNKFFAVVRREYVQRVRSKMFVILTVGAPLMVALFTVVPMLIAGIRSGGPVRIAVLDETGRMYERVESALTRSGEDDEEDAARASQPAPAMNQNGAERMKQAAGASEQGYAVERVESGNESREALIDRLNGRVKSKELDAYLVLPKDVLSGGEAVYYSRNVADQFTRNHVRDALTRAVRVARLEERGISPEVMRAVNQSLKMKTAKAGGGAGEAEDKGEGFALVFGTGFIIYLSILLYGQVVLGAVVEEKETRIAEILFSSIRPFPLMFGKLIGVSLVALTQFAIWGLAFALFSLYGVAMLAAQGVPININLNIPASAFAYVLLFFALGYFLYASLYALVGSMVTTAQEGGQLAMPIIMMLVVGFYLVFPVMRGPDSPFAFWVSMVPFFAPITMLARIMTQTPPAWQIALSLAIGFSTVALLVWLAGRVYRVGMLMYGKRATIPEMLKWVRRP